MKRTTIVVIALLVMIGAARAIFIAKGNWHRQEVAVANKHFQREVNAIKMLPPDSCGKYHIREVAPASPSIEDPLLIVSIRDSSGVKIFTSSSEYAMINWLANETKSCGADRMVLLTR
jgi:hypothetical protein